MSRSDAHPRRSRWSARAAWAVAIAVIAALASPVWVGWWDDPQQEPAGMLWFVAGMFTTLALLTIIAELRVGPGRAIPLVAAPFLLVAAWPLLTSDPLGFVGVLTLTAVVLVGTAVLSAATAAVQQALRGRGSPPSLQSS